MLETELSKTDNPNPASVGMLAHYSSSPIPSPEQLEHYENIYPGAAKLIIDKFIEERSNAMEIEKNESDANIASMSRYYDIKSKECELKDKEIKLGLFCKVSGQTLSTVFYLASLAVSGYLAMNGNDAVAIAIVAIPFAGIIRALIGNKK
jgi:uncharacterized membrane protein